MFKLSSKLAVAVAAGVNADAQAGYSLKSKIQIGGDGRWDYATVDSAAHRLYLTRTTHTQVVDLNTQKVLLDVPVPTAELQAAAADQRPAPKPDTFMVAVVAPAKRLSKKRKPLKYNWGSDLG